MFFSFSPSMFIGLNPFKSLPFFGFDTAQLLEGELLLRPGYCTAPIARPAAVQTQHRAGGAKATHRDPPPLQSRQQRPLGTWVSKWAGAPATGNFSWYNWYSSLLCLYPDSYTSICKLCMHKTDMIWATVNICLMAPNHDFLPSAWSLSSVCSDNKVIETYHFLSQ